MKKKILPLLLTAVMLITAGCAGNTPDKPGTSDGAITATQMAEAMGTGLNLGNTMEAYDADGCERIEYEWIPVCGDNKPTDYEKEWGATHKDSTECLGIVLDKLDEYGFVPVLWDTSNNFYDRNSCQIKNESDRTLIAGLSE